MFSLGFKSIHYFFIFRRLYILFNTNFFLFFFFLSIVEHSMSLWPLFQNTFKNNHKLQLNRSEPSSLGLKAQQS